MIEVNGLVKKYGERVAVDHISFNVKKGEILGFLGQNGAGKTTTMKILTGFMSATSGQVKVAGFDVFEEPMEVKKRIGYLPETPPIYTELLVSEYLNFAAELRVVSKADRPRKIDRAIERCQLGDVRNRLIGNLSKGYRQRVGIAQAIVHEPEVVILDEPTIGLDPKQVAEARELIKGMRNERTLIYSTHILSEVAATCDRIIVIDKGKLVAQESLDTYSAHGVVKTELILKSINEVVIASIQKVPGVRSVKTATSGAQKLIVESDSKDDVMAEIAKAVVGSNAGLLNMAPVKLSLEEHYLELIGARRSV
jgi:ABC-2 type transport system ATP-binding protein